MSIVQRRHQLWRVAALAPLSAVALIMPGCGGGEAECAAASATGIELYIQKNLARGKTPAQIIASGAALYGLTQTCTEFIDSFDTGATGVTGPTGSQ